MKTRLIILASLAVLATPGFTADLQVAVQKVRSDDGQIKLMLFEREEGFRKENKARQVLNLPASSGMVIGAFRDLPPGRYAVIAYHDENGNGKIDLRFGMYPIEGHGLSSNPRIFGPPKFKDAAFELPEQGLRIDIHLEY